MEIRYYSSFEDDMVTNPGQDYRLPEDYRWVRDDLPSRLLSALIYWITWNIAAVYAAAVWHIRVEGREKLMQARGEGYFMYGNHTQPFGDVVIPAWTNRWRRIYTVASPSNLGIPVIGRLLPYMGALPADGTAPSVRSLASAVKRRIEDGSAVIIYPEAHVWPYCTVIRPFPSASFTFPAESGSPVFSMTATYQKRRLRKRPRMTVYIDGPFRPDMSLSRRARRDMLHSQVYEAMVSRTCMNTAQVVEYRKAGAEDTEEDII